MHALHFHAQLLRKSASYCYCLLCGEKTTRTVVGCVSGYGSSVCSWVVDRCQLSRWKKHTLTRWDQLCLNPIYVHLNLIEWSSKNVRRFRFECQENPNKYVFRSLFSEGIGFMLIFTFCLWIVSIGGGKWGPKGLFIDLICSVSALHNNQCRSIYRKTMNDWTIRCPSSVQDTALAASANTGDTNTSARYSYTPVRARRRWEAKMRNKKRPRWEDEREESEMKAAEHQRH